MASDALASQLAFGATPARRITSHYSRSLWSRPDGSDPTESSEQRTLSVDAKVRSQSIFLDRSIVFRLTASTSRSALWHEGVTRHSGSEMPNGRLRSPQFEGLGYDPGRAEGSAAEPAEIDAGARSLDFVSLGEKDATTMEQPVCTENTAPADDANAPRTDIANAPGLDEADAHMPDETRWEEDCQRGGQRRSTEEVAGQQNTLPSQEPHAADPPLRNSATQSEMSAHGDAQLLGWSSRRSGRRLDSASDAEAAATQSLQSLVDAAQSTLRAAQDLKALLQAAQVSDGAPTPERTQSTKIAYSAAGMSEVIPIEDDLMKSTVTLMPPMQGDGTNAEAAPSETVFEDAGVFKAQGVTAEAGPPLLRNVRLAQIRQYQAPIDTKDASAVPASSSRWHSWAEGATHKKHTQLLRSATPQPRSPSPLTISPSRWLHRGASDMAVDGRTALPRVMSLAQPPSNQDLSSLRAIPLSAGRHMEIVRRMQLQSPVVEFRPVGASCARTASLHCSKGSPGQQARMEDMRRAASQPPSAWTDGLHRLQRIQPTAFGVQRMVSLPCDTDTRSRGSRRELCQRMPPPAIMQRTASAPLKSIGPTPISTLCGAEDVNESAGPLADMESNTCMDSGQREQIVDGLDMPNPDNKSCESLFGCRRWASCGCGLPFSSGSGCRDRSPQRHVTFAPALTLERQHYLERLAAVSAAGSAASHFSSAPPRSAVPDLPEQHFLVQPKPSDAIKLLHSIEAPPGKKGPNETSPKHNSECAEKSSLPLHLDTMDTKYVNASPFFEDSPQSSRAGKGAGAVIGPVDGAGDAAEPAQHVPVVAKPRSKSPDAEARQPFRAFAHLRSPQNRHCYENATPVFAKAHAFCQTTAPILMQGASVSSALAAESLAVASPLTRSFRAVAPQDQPSSLRATPRAHIASLPSRSASPPASQIRMASHRSRSLSTEKQASAPPYSTLRQRSIGSSPAAAGSATERFSSFRRPHLRVPPTAAAFGVSSLVPKAEVVEEYRGPRVALQASMPPRDSSGGSPWPVRLARALPSHSCAKPGCAINV